MGSKRVGKEGRLIIRILKAPIWILTRAHDLYIQSLTGGGGHVSYGNAMGCPTPQIPKTQRSFSSSSFKSAEEELKDLIRLASSQSLQIEAEFRRTKSAIPLGGGGGVVAPVARSRTVGFARIDEDKPLIDLGEDEKTGLLMKKLIKI